MSFIGDITGLGSVAEAANGVVKSITDVVGKFIPDPNIKAQAEVEIRKVVAEGQKAQFEAMSQVMTADANSDSKFTKNARPTVVYWSLGMITAITVASLFGASDPILVALSKVPDKLYDMITYGIGAYVLGRSAEKSTSVVADAVKAVITRKK